jgi:hypothetical protein
MVQEAGRSIARRSNPTTYEELMDIHGEGLANLNISLCRECLYPLKPEEGDYCNDCKP